MDSQKALEAHGCKPWVANLWIVPHTLGILTAYITYCIILLEYANVSHVNTQVLSTVGIPHEHQKDVKKLPGIVNRKFLFVGIFL